VEYRLKGEIVKNRIKAYQRIIIFISEIYKSVAPPKIVVSKYKDMIGGMPFKISVYEYPSYMNSQREFDAYYKDLSNMCGEEHIFLDANVEYWVNMYLDYLSEVKMILDAYCDMENSRTDISKEDCLNLINFAYLSFGITLSNDFGRFYNNIDNVIAREVSALSLGFRNKRFKVRYYNLRYNLALSITKLRNSKLKIISSMAYRSYKFFFSRMANNTLIYYPNYLILILMRIHYSTNYSAEQFDLLSDDEQQNLIEKFHSRFISLYHVE
jgi:hypothetical protein